PTPGLTPAATPSRPGAAGRPSPVPRRRPRTVSVSARGGYRRGPRPCLDQPEGARSGGDTQRVTAGDGSPSTAAGGAIGFEWVAEEVGLREGAALRSSSTGRSHWRTHSADGWCQPRVLLPSWWPRRRDLRASVNRP